MVKRGYFTVDRLARRLLIISTLMNLMFLGGMLNITAMQNNGGKMPVYAEYFDSDEEHFTFSNPEEVDCFYLTDIIKANLGIFDLYFSIGDILIVGGLFIFTNYMITVLILDGVYIYFRLTRRVKMPHYVRRQN